MPYKVKGKCVYKKDTGKKVGCTKGSVKKYLAALHANVSDSVQTKLSFKDFFLLENDSKDENFSYWLTQRNNTQTSYSLQNEVFKQLFPKGSIIVDYGSGLGLFENIFTHFNYVDFEPYPQQRQQPDYTDSSALLNDYAGKASGVVCNLVLNVIDKVSDRANAIETILKLLKVGGVAYIVTRTDKQVQEAKSKIKHGDGWKIKTQDGYTFQKGFSSQELKQLVKTIASTLQNTNYEIVNGVGAGSNAKIGIKRIL